MSNGASYVHMRIRGELENYIKAQYFAKSPLSKDVMRVLFQKLGLKVVGQFRAPLHRRKKLRDEKALYALAILYAAGAMLVGGGDFQRGVNVLAILGVDKGFEHGFLALPLQLLQSIPKAGQIFLIGGTVRQNDVLVGHLNFIHFRQLHLK